MKSFLKTNGNWIAFFILAIIIGALTKGDLFSARNLTNLVRQVSVNGILASGMTMVILTGGIDLSIGSVVALTGVIVGISQFNWGWGAMGVSGAALSIFVGIISGSIIGAINGGLISFLGIAPFVITLGMMVIARGVGLILTNGSGISPMGDSLVNAGQTYLPETPTVVLLALILAYVVWNNRRRLQDTAFAVVGLLTLGYAFLGYKGFPCLALFLTGTVFLVAGVLGKTPFGRSVYAVGSNEQAAVWAGVSVRKTKWLVYTFMGMFAGLAGALVTARQNGASPTAGELAELDAIAAVVIGGTSLTGGSGSVIGSIVGAFIIGLLNNGMDLLEVPSFYQMVFKGVIIIIAVSIDRAQRGRTA
jgi:ribose/xylose/arabinose/galactoside ABC-type transport system permease subunit